MQTNYSYTNGRNYLKNLMERKKSFSWKFSGQLEILEYNGRRKIFNCDPWTKETFILQTQIKKELEEQEPPAIDTNINYFDFQPPKMGKTKTFKNVKGIDLSAAYQTFAYNLGYISEVLYKKCLEANKVSRLRSWGAIAKKNTTFHFDRGECKESENDTSKLRPFFFSTARHVGEVMNECKEISGENYLFHWVDCVFFEANAKKEQEIIDLLDLYNLPYHFEEIEYITINSLSNLYRVEKKEKGKNKKRFNFAKNKVEKYEFVNF